MLKDNSFEDPDGKCTRGLQIANEIIKRGLKIPYQVNFRAEFWKVATPEMIETLKRSGLIAVSIGIETANEGDRRVYRKYASIEDNVKIVELFRSHDIHVNTNFIMFNPYSTFEGLRQNIDYLERLNHVTWDYISNSYKILEGTPLSEKIKVDGLSVYSGVYNDVFAYKYKDPRMEPMIKYFYLQHEWILKQNAYVTQFWSALELFRKQYEVSGEIEVSESFKQPEDFVKNMCDIIGHRIAEWFRKLLDLAENGWDAKAADEMEFQIMNSKEVLTAFYKLEEASKEIYAALKEIGLVA
jgi:radical SAM superfamily enzyme YgiQ (UPF0313 family)